jgi:hypothetical protein
MIVYDTAHTTGYEIVNCKSYEDIRVLADFDGTSRKEGWTPVHVRRDRVNRREAFKPADLPYSHDALMMRRSGFEALRDMLETYGEILPLATDDGVELWVHNILGVLDAHDLERSNIRHSDPTDAAVIYEHVFVPSVIGEAEMFRTSVNPRRVYFTDRFVERVKKLKLKGTDFVPLWSSEGPLPKGKSK